VYRTRERKRENYGQLFSKNNFLELAVLFYINYYSFLLMISNFYIHVFRKRIIKALKKTLLHLAVYLDNIMKCTFNKKKEMTAGTESDKLFAQETGNIKADDGLLASLASAI